MKKRVVEENEFRRRRVTDLMRMQEGVRVEGGASRTKKDVYSLPRIRGPPWVPLNEIQRSYEGQNCYLGPRTHFYEEGFQGTENDGGPSHSPSTFSTPPAPGPRSALQVLGQIPSKPQGVKVCLIIDDVAVT
jgi:hypothetical protein